MSNAKGVAPSESSSRNEPEGNKTQENSNQAPNGGETNNESSISISKKRSKGTSERIKVKKRVESIDYDNPEALKGRYTQGDFLARGAYKDVYKGYDTLTGTECCWNEVKLSGITNSQLDNVYREIAILKTIQSDYIIGVSHHWIDESSKSIIFITELLSSGTLKKYIQKSRKINLYNTKKWSKQVLKGIAYLHQKNIIHRDIKCENIFINGVKGDLKIGDLGLSVIKQNKYKKLSVIGTTPFIAPELYHGTYNEKVDIYAFGMTVLEMVTGEYPYNECENDFQIMQFVQNGNLPGALKEKISHGPLRNFIKICIRKDPEKRPSAKELLLHEFFKKDTKNDGKIVFLLPSGVLEEQKRQEKKRKEEEARKIINTEKAKNQNNGAITSPLHENGGSPVPGNDKPKPQRKSAGTNGGEKKAKTWSKDRFKVSVEVRELSNVEGRGSKSSNGHDVLVLVKLIVVDTHCDSRKEVTFPFCLENDTVHAIATEIIGNLSKEKRSSIIRQKDSEFEEKEQFFSKFLIPMVVTRLITHLRSFASLRMEKELVKLDGRILVRVEELKRLRNRKRIIQQEALGGGDIHKPLLPGVLANDIST